MASESYHFKNKFTNHYVISTNQDTEGHVVNTVSGATPPKDSVSAHPSALAFTTHTVFFFARFYTFILLSLGISP